MTDQADLISQLRRALEEANVRERELVRHVRNALAVVRSLVRNPLEDSGDLEAYRTALTGRVDAFARAQSSILNGISDGADLENILRDQLMGFGVRGDNGFELAGPPVRIAARAVGLVALLVHELARATLIDNARLPSIGWRTADDGAALEIAWHHALAECPDLHWLERALEYELNAVFSVRGDGTGTHCILLLPNDFWSG